ncbi:MAG: Holliday junction resolvase RuvX [Prevotella sp.]|nr:Holliday junction resolvase RuvX [Prevotella sp.]
MGRILAIDYGKKCTGLAVTDMLQIVPGALDTVDTKNLMDYLCDYVKREQVEKIVIGEPRQPNGMPSENMQRVQQFKAQWQKRHPEIPIVGYDERFTSVLAHQTMIDAGLRKKARQDKALTDRISATIILQDYMNSL